ncbi:MAG: carbohydrate kinase family protein [Sediminicola sp.]|tara:strand:+ start:82082 stop:83029 length:948 start_codon:yes stop_codon:yes gene_type:complete
MTKKFDVIVIGELNVDLIFNRINGFPEMGKEILADGMTLALGSSSAICASNMSSLGLKVAFLGKLGKDIFGQFIIRELNKKGVDTSLVIIDENLPTGATMALSYDEERAMVTHQGAMSHLGINDVDMNLLGLAQHVHFSSYFLQPGFHGSLHGLFENAKALGLTTSLDIQWDPSDKWDLNLDIILPFVDIFFPNEIELQKLTGKKNLEEALESVRGKSGYTLVKRGNKGSLMCYGEKKISAGPFLNKEVVDAIGAGDSFNAGYLYKFLQGSPPEECQIFGNLTGAVSTTETGGTEAFKNFDHVMRIASEKFNYSE